MLYLNTEKTAIEDRLQQEIACNLQKIALLETVIQETEKIKHHQKITKKIVTNLKAQGVASYLDTTYSTKLKIYIPNRIWRTTPPDRSGISGSIYFENDTEIIYFNDYQELIDNSRKRINCMKESNAKFENELETLGAIIQEAEEIQKRHNAFNDNVSYITRGALNFK